MTIKDVANACGVSTQTISRVINNRVDVSPATREKILAVIEQMGYQPSALARGMRQKSRILGVIVTGLKYKGISTTLNGIVKAAEQFGMSIILKELAVFGVKDTQPVIQSLVAHQVQGIIYAAPEVGENWFTVQENINTQSLPMVFLKGNPSSAPLTISIDNYYGAYLITSHLIEQGYQRIAHITGLTSWWEAKERKRGWHQAIIDNGLELDDRACVEGNWSSDMGLKAFETLLAQYPEMDAVFAANDQTALAVLHGAWKKGISVPNQLGVCGYDNLSESRFFTPELTTIHQDFHRLGELAVRKLLKLISPERQDEEVEDNSIIIKPELIIRSSTQKKVTE